MDTTKTINEKITAVKNSEDLKKLEAKYEAKIAELSQQKLDWENAAIAEKDEKLEVKGTLETELKITRQERDEWKKEAHASRKAYQVEKKTKEETDFMSELAKLQAKKGIDINDNN